MKNTWKRFLSLVLCLCMVSALIPNMAVPAFAATEGEVTGLSNENIGLSFSGDAEDAWLASGTTITGSVASVTGSCGNTDYNSTLTITNNKSAAATLSFKYSIAQNSGTIQVAGTAVTEGGTYSSEIEAGESIKVYIKSGSTTATTITMTEIALVTDGQATTTFEPAENGSYTVDGDAVTESRSITQSSLQAYQVAATSASGYQFLGWYDVTNQKYLSTSATAELKIETSCTVTAKFVLQTATIFETGGQPFENLGEAAVFATNNNQSLIKLVSGGTIDGQYIIPAGVTLLIPFDDAGTLYTTAPGVTRTASASKAYRTLTMASGSSITAYGNISLGGQYYAAGGGEQGRCVGDYGCIKMQDGSSITMKNGGSLYAWGFVTGSGSVLAESGAAVYEFYQIGDFRGGSATLAMSSSGVFPFNQYFIQNVEVPLTLQAGATESVYSGMYASSKTYTTDIQFIGDSGMFKIVSGSFTKDYEEATDRLVFTVDGEVELNTLSLKLAGQSLDSADYVLPITNNVSVNIVSGKVTINQDAALQAGVEISVAEGADLTIANGKNVYVYDSDEWNSDNFVWGSVKFKSVVNAPGKVYTRTAADLKDVKIDVNGSITVNGAVYTTAGGADICSSKGTGRYLQQAAPGAASVTYQYNASSEKISIAITPAKLHNADGSYTATADAQAGDVVSYVKGVWVNSPAVITFMPNGSEACPVEGTMEQQVISIRAGGTLQKNAFTTSNEGYRFNGWNTAADGSGDSYADEAAISPSGDMTLYAQWQFWNGWLTDENGKQYYKDGELQKTGWTVIDGSTYYLNTETGYAATGIATLIPGGATEEVRCVFDDNGVFQSDVTGVYSIGEVTYWLNSGIIEEEAGLKRIVKADGEVNYYYFAVEKNLEEREGLTLSAAVKSSMLNGQDCWLHKTNDLPLPEWGYCFDENGVILHDADTSKNGIHMDGGALCYYVDGIKAPAGMVQIDEDYYYVNNRGQLIVSKPYYCSRTNDLKEEGWYEFDENGKLTGPAKNGIYEEDENLYFYRNGTRTYVGLIQIDGDYYYVNSGCKVVCDCRYYVTWTHGLVEQGYYEFDETGKMIGAAKTGIYEEDGSLYYYRNGERAYAGLIQIDGDYYYVNKHCEVVHDCSYYVYWTHDLMEQGYYSFDSDGRMILDSETE